MRISRYEITNHLEHIIELLRDIAVLNEEITSITVLGNTVCGNSDYITIDID